MLPQDFACEILERAALDREEKIGITSDGITTSESRGIARSAGIATDQRSARNVDVRARIGEAV